MKGKLNDRDAKCPFLLAHKKTEIYCEAPLWDCMMSLRFGEEEKKREQYKGYCCETYQRCEIYRANMKKYEEE